MGGIRRLGRRPILEPEAADTPEFLCIGGYQSEIPGKRLPRNKDVVWPDGRATPGQIGPDKPGTTSPHIALTISSVIFLASWKSIMVLSRKKSSLPMPA